MTNTPQNAPERIWAYPWHQYENKNGSGSSQTEYIRADLAFAMVAAALEDAAEAMAQYHWNRYRTREQGGVLHSPATFTSHTWQDAQDAIRALIPQDARAALEAERAKARAEGVREGMERAAKIAETERDKRNDQRRKWTGCSDQRMRWTAGALQANSIAAAIRAAMEGTE